MGSVRFLSLATSQTDQTLSQLWEQVTFYYVAIGEEYFHFELVKFGIYLL